MDWKKYKIPPALYGKIRFEIFEESLLSLLDPDFYDDKAEWKRHNQTEDDSEGWEMKSSNSYGTKLKGFNETPAYRRKVLTQGCFLF